MSSQALVFNLALLGALFVAVFLFMRLLFPKKRHASSRSKRLEIQETCPLDKERVLTIVRCDGREYLLLTGGQNDMLVSALEGPDFEGSRPKVLAKSPFAQELSPPQMGGDPALSFPPLKTEKKVHKPVIFSEDISTLSSSVKEPAFLSAFEKKPVSSREEGEI